MLFNHIEQDSEEYPKGVTMADRASIVATIEKRRKAGDKNGIENFLATLFDFSQMIGQPVKVLTRFFEQNEDPSFAAYAYTAVSLHRPAWVVGQLVNVQPTAQGPLRMNLTTCDRIIRLDLHDIEDIVIGRWSVNDVGS